MMKKIIKLLLAASLVLSGTVCLNENNKVNANNIETRAVQIQMGAAGEKTSLSMTYNGKTITYTVSLTGYYITDQNQNILSTNIGATTVSYPTSSMLQSYVRGIKTTFSGKVATTVVTIGFKFNDSIITTTKEYTFTNPEN